jgi:hypothetical protein
MDRTAILHGDDCGKHHVGVRQFSEPCFLDEDNGLERFIAKTSLRTHHATKRLKEADVSCHKPKPLSGMNSVRLQRQ